MREFITIMETTSSYPPVLTTPEAVADYITELDPKASYEDIWEWANEDMRDAHFELRMLPIDQVHEGHPDANIRNPAKERRYAKLSTPMPPLILDWQNNVMDGNHRFRVAKAKGLTEIPCYVLVDS